MRIGGLQSEIDRLHREITALGAVNLAALDELKLASERKVFLDAQTADLTEAWGAFTESRQRAATSSTRSRDVSSSGREVTVAAPCVAGIAVESFEQVIQVRMVDVATGLLLPDLGPPSRGSLLSNALLWDVLEVLDSPAPKDEEDRRILEELDDAHGLMSQRGASPRGRLKVSLPTTIGRQVIVPALPAFSLQRAVSTMIHSRSSAGAS